MTPSRPPLRCPPHPPRLPWGIGAIVIAATLLLVRPATAQDPPPAETTPPPASAEIADSPEELYRRGSELLEQGKLDAALKTCQAAFDAYNLATDAIGPDKPRYLIAVGDALTLQRRIDPAIQVYLRAIEFELLGLPCDSRFDLALDRMVNVLSGQYSQLFALEMWTRLINRGYLNIHLALAESDLERARRIAQLTSSLTRDLIAVADPQRPDHVTAAFTFASREKALEDALQAPHGIPVKNTRLPELERTLARYHEVEQELLRMPVESTIAGQNYLESRTQVKLGTLEQLAEWIPDYVVQLTYAVRATELLDGLNAKLPPNSALVEFATATNRRDDSRRDLLAFVAHKTGDGELLLSKIWVEEQREVLFVTNQWRELQEVPGEDLHKVRQAGLDVREIFWRPIAKVIGDSSQVILCRTPNLSQLHWESIPGVPRPPDSQPFWFWPLLAAAGLVLIVALLKKSFWWLVGSLVLMLATAGVWYQGQTRLPVAGELGNDYEFQVLRNAYEYLRAESPDSPAIEADPSPQPPP